MDELFWIFWIVLIVITHSALSYKWHKLYLFMYGLSGVTQVAVVFYALTQPEWGREAILLILVVAGLGLLGEGYAINQYTKRRSGDAVQETITERNNSLNE
jgi:predicted ferric reductase